MCDPTVCRSTPLFNLPPPLSILYLHRTTLLPPPDGRVVCSFVASVQEVMRAEGRDQLDWTARRRRRCATAAATAAGTRAINSPTDRAVRERDRKRVKQRERELIG